MTELDIQTALQSAGPDVLLSAYVNAFNDYSEKFDDMELELGIKRSEIASLKSDIDKATATIAQMSDDQQQLTEMCDKVIALHEAQKKEMEKIRRENEALSRQKELATAKANDLQKQLTANKQIGDPKKMRDQIKRLKEKNSEKENEIGRLKSLNKNNGDRLKRTVDELKDIKKQIETNGGDHVEGDQYGVYHQGEHHLIYWAQKIGALTDTGERIESRALLYMHQSGCGRLLLLDNETGKVVAAKTPKSGVRMPKAVMEFAENWLYKVNQIQGGEVKPDDLQVVNLNE